MKGQHAGLAENSRRDEGIEAIHHAGSQKRGAQPTPAFTKNGADVSGPQRRQGLAQIKSSGPGIPGYAENLDATLRQLRFPLRRCIGPGEHPNRYFPSAERQLGLSRQPELRIEHNPHRRPTGRTPLTNGELRVVRQNGTDAYHDSVVTGPESMGRFDRRARREARRAPGGRRQPSIERHGVLQRHKRPIPTEACQVDDIERPSFVLAKACLHLEPLRPQPGGAAGRVGIRIRYSVGHAFDPRLEDRTRAGPPLTRVVTWLQGHVESGALGPLTRRFQRRHLGMNPAPFGVIALTDDGSIANDDSTNHRVGRHPPPPFLGQVKGTAHVPNVVFAAHSESRIPIAPNKLPDSISSPVEITNFSVSCQPSSPTMLKNSRM